MQIQYISTRELSSSGTTTKGLIESSSKQIGLLPTYVLREGYIVTTLLKLVRVETAAKRSWSSQMDSASDACAVPCPRLKDGFITNWCECTGIYLGT